MWLSLLVAACAATAELAVNGLYEADLSSSPFPAPGSFVLTWTAPDLDTEPTAFVVEVKDEWSSWPSQSNVSSGAKQLQWSSGKQPVSSFAPNTYALPRSLTDRFTPDTTYDWRVQLLSGATAGVWQQPVAFDVAPAASAWEKADWIGGGSQLRTDWTIPATATNPIVRARAYASGLGLFELHLNGKQVGDHVTDPGEAVYDQKALFVGFNITSLLTGSNAVGALLGNGKWGYLDIYTNRTAAGDQSGASTRAFRLLLVATLLDGTTHTLESSAAGGWKTRMGPIVYDHLWHGEIYDFRLEALASSGINNDSNSKLRWDEGAMSAFAAHEWATSAVAMQPKVGQMFPQLMPPIRVVKTFEPVAVQSEGYRSRRNCNNDVKADCDTSNNDSMMFDFGQNMAGFSTLTLDLSVFKKHAETAAGTSTIMLRLKHTEITSKDGEAYNNFYPGMEFNHASATCDMQDWYQRKWYECANQTDGVIFEVPSQASPASATQTLTYTPTFTYHGFRHVELSATELLADGTEAPLAPALAALFPFGAKLVAHKANSDIRVLTELSLPESERRSAQSEDIGADAVDTHLSRLLGGIFNATMASHQSNLWSIPTDCPQREKRGWMGDAGISSNSLATFHDSFAFHANFLRLIADNQRKMCVDQPTTSIYKACSDPSADTQHMGAAKWFNGSVPDVTPFATGPYGGNPGTTDWQVAYILIARAVLQHYGGLAQPLLAELWSSLDLLMDYFERLVDKKTGLLLTGARGDWIPPEGNSKGPYPTPTEPISAFFHTLCVASMADIANAIGAARAADAQRYTMRLAANRKAFHKQFYNGKGAVSSASDSARDSGNASGSLAFETRCCYSKGSQTANVFALYIGAVPDDLVNATVGMLVASIYDRNAQKPAALDSGATATATATTTATAALPEPRPELSGGATGLPLSHHPAGPPAWGSGAHLDVGIFGTTYIFDILRYYHQDTAALAVLNNTAYPSFGYMLSQGATTLWEGWDGTANEISFEGTSRNHIMFGGGVNRYIASAVGGLSLAESPPLAAGQASRRRASANGWRRLAVAPAPAAVRSLRRAAFARETPTGRAASAWQLSDGALELNVTVPAYATATVEMPLLDFGMVNASAGAIVSMDGCKMRCDAVDIAASLAEDEESACAFLLSPAICERRWDGERVLAVEIGVGQRTFRTTEDLIL